MTKDNDIDINIPEFDDMSEEFMDLLEKMLNNDQFLRPSFIDCTHHEAFLKNYKDSDSNTPITNQEKVKKNLKIFDGEMKMYSALIGIFYTQLVFSPKKWNKKIKKHLKPILVNSKIPKEKLSEAFKYFTVEPKILEFHVEKLLEKLDQTKEEYSVEEVLFMMKQLDLEHYKEKVKESFEYFEDPSGVEADVILRVLKRMHAMKESKLTDQIQKYQNGDGKIN